MKILNIISNIARHQVKRILAPGGHAFRPCVTDDALVTSENADISGRCKASMAPSLVDFSAIVPAQSDA